MSKPSTDYLSLADWRREIAHLYARIRTATSPELGRQDFAATRDGLFKHHPETPLARQDRDAFAGLTYFPYLPRWRTSASVVPCEPVEMEMAGLAGSTYTFNRFATAEFEVDGLAASLDMYWLESYSGGIFVPFADASSGVTTYGGGRYLLDTPKGADLGMEGNRIVFDFNFAYHPSCFYDPRWSCPLAPPGNRLTFAVTAGERVSPAAPPSEGRP